MMPACELLRSQQRVSCPYSPQRARRSVLRGPLRVISEPLFNPTSHLSSAPVSYPIPRDNWTCVGFVDCFRLRINGDPTVKQFGLGMAVAVALDATVVRCVLVPAIMSLLGSSGWWLPKWMERATLKLLIEDNAWFAEHETPANAQADE